jgi:putative ABC transport system permease protein
MTWPFENDTSAIVKKLANRSIKSDKKSKAFLLFTIALSVCMVFSIILISIGTQEEYKNTQRNKAQIGILGITDEQLALLRQNTDVSWVGEYSAIGLFYEDSKTITVAYGNEDYFLHQEEKTFQGSVPQSGNEIILPQNYIDFIGKTYQVGDTITLDLTGTGIEKEYTLTGILNDAKESNGYFIYVNKKLAHNIAGDTFQVTAYTRFNTDAISSKAILDFADSVIQDTGIEEGQVNLTEYFAVMSGAIKSGIPIPVPLLAILTAILAATIVYGIFYTKITKNVQMFGQLRTVGMTKRQIKRMARKEGRQYALAGIPIGLIVGLLIGFIGCPGGFRLKITLVYAVIIAVVAFITVNIAIFKPVRVAMNTSPVEGSKYLVYSGKAKSSRKLHRKLTPFNLAKINIQRNKQKAILTLAMLGLSGALLLVTSTVAGSIDPQKQARFKYYPDGNIQIYLKNFIGSSFDKESEPYGSSKLQLEENPLKAQMLMQELAKIDGIEKITSSDCLNMTITFPGGSGSITSITDFFPTLNRERITEKQSILSAGTADYDDMVARNGILVAEDTAKIGDTLKIAGRSPDGSTFDIEAVVVGTYNRADLMKNSPVIPGSPYFIMTYDTAKKLTGITEQTGVLSLEVSEEYFEDVLSTVQKIADENGKIEVNTIEQTIASIQKYYSPSIKTFYMISAILFVFGVISLMNMLMVDFQNRKREFGLLEAVGTTQNQLKAMLNREIGIYLWGSLAISLIGGNIFSIIVCGRLDASNHCITLQLPWIFLVALVAVLIAIYLVFSMYAKSELKKTSILSAIREN